MWAIRPTIAASEGGTVSRSHPLDVSKLRLIWMSGVSIDLRDACMRDGKPGYERHKVSLRRMGEIDVMLAFANAKGT